MPTYDQLINKDVLDAEGDKVGKLDSFYVNEGSDSPDWIAIKTGMFGNRISFVPLESAQPVEDSVKVNFTKDQIKAAPNVEADGEIGPEEETELYNYYNQLDTLVAESSSQDDGDNGDSPTRADSGAHDGAMTRSEEEVRVDKQQVETGTVRLKKYVVTENVNFTVPIKKEKIRVDRRPVTDEEAGGAYEGASISDSVHEEVLREEQLIVDKKVVPKERISLQKDTVEEQAQVDEQVRKEQVDVEGDEDR